MRKVISNVISFITSILLFSLLLIVSIKFESSRFYINIDRINYYDKAYNSIVNEISNSIINEEIKNDYLNIISLDQVKYDVDNSINGIGFNNYKMFENVIKKYSKDKTIIDKYSSLVNDIYENNVYSEKIIKFNELFNKFESKIIMISIILLIVIILFEIVLYLINKNVKYIYNNLLSFSIYGILSFLVLILINNFSINHVMELILMTFRYSFILCFTFGVVLFTFLIIIYFLFIRKNDNI